MLREVRLPRLPRHPPAKPSDARTPSAGKLPYTFGPASGSRRSRHGRLASLSHRPHYPSLLLGGRGAGRRLWAARAVQQCAARMCGV